MLQLPILFNGSAKKLYKHKKQSLKSMLTKSRIDFINQTLICT